jgi:hypothetical protein
MVENLSRLLRDSGSLVRLLQRPAPASRWEWHDVDDLDINRINSAAACSGTAEALGRFGPTAACEEVLAGLAEVLSIGDWEISFCAAEALVRLQSNTAHQTVIEQLTRSLLDGHVDVRLRAAEALMRLGQYAKDHAAGQLMKLLRDPDIDRSWETIDGLTEGQKSAQRDIAFIHRERAVEALVRLGVASDSGVLAQLQDWLRPDQRDYSYSLRTPGVAIAAKALSQLKQAPGEAALERLSAGLLHTNEAAFRSVTGAIGLLGPTAANGSSLKQDARGD